MIPPLHWNDQAFRVDLLDQTRLPVEEVWLEIETPAQMAEAIRRLSVRGAPAIGIAAAYGVVLALRDDPVGDFHQTVLDTIEMLAQTRPTAVNLFYALDAHPRLGTEFNLKNVVALRAGINRVTNSDRYGTDFTPSVGAGLRLKQVNVDYGFGDFGGLASDLGYSHRISVRLTLERPGKGRLEEAERAEQ